MDRKQLKIEAKQALETWEQRLIQINQWDEADIPQNKMDELVHLAMHSSGDISDVIHRLNQWMDGNPLTEDFVQLRGDLSTALKESLNFRLTNSDYTRHQLFEEIDDIENIIDISDLFMEDEAVEVNVFDQPAAINEVEADLIERLDSPDAFAEEEPEQILSKEHLDDFLFDVED